MFLSIHGSKENSKTVVFNRSLSFITFFCQLPFRCVVILSKKMNYNFFRIFFNLPVIFLFLYTQEKGFRYTLDLSPVIAAHALAPPLGPVVTLEMTPSI